MSDPPRLPTLHITGSEVGTIREELGISVLDALRIARGRKLEAALAAATSEDDRRLIIAATKETLL